MYDKMYQNIQGLINIQRNELYEAVKWVNCTLAQLNTYNDANMLVFSRYKIYHGMS